MQFQALKKKLWNLYKNKEQVIDMGGKEVIFYRGVKLEKMPNKHGEIEYHVFDTSYDNYQEIECSFLVESLLLMGNTLEDYNDKQERIKSGKVIYPVGLDRILESVGR